MPGIHHHHPEVVQRPDGRFEVRCPECSRDSLEPVPVGIGVAIADEKAARLIRTNHLTRS